MMDKSCILAAALFALGSLLSTLNFLVYNARSSFDMDDFQDLVTSSIISEWEYRTTHQALANSAGWMNALAWFVLCVPILQVVVLQSMKGPKMLAVHVATGLLVISGAIMELTSHLLYIGTTNAMGWASEEMNLNLWVDGGSGVDAVGWKTLELIHLAARGFTVWTGGIEWLFLSLMLVLIYVSVRGQHGSAFCKRWARFGLVLASICMVIFVADILESQFWWTFSTIHGVLYAISHLFLFPMWLIWLAKQLPNAFEEQVTSQKRQKDSVSIMETIGEPTRLS